MMNVKCHHAKKELCINFDTSTILSLSSQFIWYLVDIINATDVENLLSVCLYSVLSVEIYKVLKYWDT